MSNARKSTRRGRRDYGVPYLRSRARLAQQFTEEKPKPVNPLAELYSIMAKMEMEDEGACAIRDESRGTMLAGEQECASCIVKYKEGLDLVKDQKEELAPNTSEGEGKPKM